MVALSACCLLSVLLHVVHARVLHELPFAFHSRQGQFEMRWGFNGTGAEEIIELEFTLPSNIFIGIGLGCVSSAKCDMIVGNGGGENEPYIMDYYENDGDVLPSTDEELGGTNDVVLVSASYVNYRSVLRFQRKLNTGDKYDVVLKKVNTPIVYAWCAGPPFCTATDTAHAPGDWEITSVDLSGKQMASVY